MNHVREGWGEGAKCFLCGGDWASEKYSGRVQLEGALAQMGSAPKF